MSTTLLPAAEHVLDRAVARATAVLRAGHDVEDAARVLVVGGYAAELLDERELLDQPATP